MTASSSASAHWEGALLTGSGSVTTSSPALDATSMTWKARTGGEPGSTPEELLAAAHASCFSMALAGALAKSGHDPEQLDTSATIEFGPVADGFAIQGIALRVEGVVPGIDETQFQEFAEGAKSGCPVSKALDPSLTVTLEASLLQHA